MKQRRKDMEPYELTATEIIALYKKRELSVKEVLESVLNRIKSIEDKIGSFLFIVPKNELLTQAETIQKKIDKGEPLGPLEGIPIAIKDNISTEGIRTSCGSRILENYIPTFDATVVERIKKAGVIIIGKTNMDEFALGSSTENSAFKVTKNPWDLTRVPGGSSGGSAAAIAADMSILALGSDTGGSIRQPASFCGVVGMKTSYGRVSRYGLVAYGSSLDQIGPLTKSVDDAALLMNVICGYDPKDSTSIDIETPDYLEFINDLDLKGKTIGVPKEYFAQGIDPEVKSIVMSGIRTFEDMGIVAEEISLPHTEYSVPAYYIIACSELSSNLARFDGVRYGYRAKGSSNIIEMYKETRTNGFGPEAKRRIMLGTYSLSAGYYDQYYNKALKVRTLIREDFLKAFKKYDVIIHPVSPMPAFKIGEKIADPLTMYLTDIYSVTANLAGLPAISIPCGFTKDGLPVGMQITGRPFQEEVVLRFARAFEQARSDLKKKPPI